METEANKKGFTLIELIIVIAIMAVLVAIIAPNVLKYLERSKVSKDFNSLDAVYIAIQTEITDEDLYNFCTGKENDKITGVRLSDLVKPNSEGESEDSTNKQYLLSKRLRGGEVTNPDILSEEFYSENSVLESRVADGAEIMFFIDGNGNVAVAAVKNGKVVDYEGRKYYISPNLDISKTNLE